MIKKGGTYYEYVVFHGMCLCCHTDGDRLLFARPLLSLFGASADAMVYAYPYMMIYLIGTLPSMVATGMNPFINAQGYSTVGMLSVTIGAVANLLLDPLFIFVFGFGVQGAAIATVISQTLSAVFVLYFLTRKSELKVRFVRKMKFLSVQAMRKYCQPRYRGIYHAADQQPCHDLLQQRTLRDRR